MITVEKINRSGLFTFYENALNNSNTMSAIITAWGCLHDAKALTAYEKSLLGDVMCARLRVIGG